MAMGDTSYLDGLKSEIQSLDPSVFPNATRFVAEELKRAESGDKKPRLIPMIDLHHNKPQNVALKVRIPINEHPKFNFVGKLLGPKGSSLKRMQEETGTKMSILGKGSVRDKNKEEEMRKEGGKYAHLNEELHVLIEVYTEASDAYNRLAHAVSEVKKYMIPEYNDEISQQQMQDMMFLNGDKPGPGGGRGRGRGQAPGPPGGGPPPHMGARGGLLQTPGGRGAPSGRGAPPARGAPRGGPPRGAMGAGRGARPAPPPPPPAPEPAYDEYGDASYDEAYGDQSGYGGYGATQGGYGGSQGGREAYDQSYGQSDTQYFDYGHGSSASQGGYDEYGDSGWGTNTAMKAPPARGGRGQYRSHPYGSGRGGGGY